MAFVICAAVVAKAWSDNVPLTNLRLASFDALSVMVGVLAVCALSAACFELVIPFLLDCAITCPRELINLIRVGEYLRYSIERCRRYSPFLYLFCI